VSGRAEGKKLERKKRGKYREEELIKRKECGRKKRGRSEGKKGGEKTRKKEEGEEVRGRN
jgi:hypothetical protein